MEFEAAARRNESGAFTVGVPGGLGDSGAGCGAVVCVDAAEVAGLSLSGLRERMGAISRAKSKLAAMQAEALREYTRRGGEGLARRMVTEELQSSRSQARREVQAAEQLARTAKTCGALASGEIPPDHAQLIAKAASEGPVDEALLVEAAKTQDYGQFSKTLRDHQQEQSQDDGQSLFEKQRQKRTASIRQSPDDGMYIRQGRFDPIAGC